MCDALDVANVDPELQRRGAHGARRQNRVPQTRFDELSVSTREIGMVSIKLVRYSDAFGALAQQISIELDVGPQMSYQIATAMRPIPR